jgi:IclR family mhp operon transcriptional activator
MNRSLENRSLDRGLAILECLSIHGASSLQDLHVRTRLPKTTIRRTLGTLLRRKVVRRSVADRLYRANVALPMLSGRLTQGEGWLVDCAVPHMIELTRSVGWSCDLHIFERTWSRIIESTRPLSPFFEYERHIDLQVPAFASACGLAVLSTWSDAAVLALIAETGEHRVWGLARLGITRGDLLAAVRRAREAGYAVRAIQYRGESPQSNTLNAIACPIFQGETAVAALAMLWPRGYLPPARFAEMHLGRLKQATAAISADLLSSTRPGGRA